MPFMKEEMKKKDTAIMEDMEKEIEQAQQELAKETEVKAEQDSIKETAEQAAEVMLQAEIDKKDAELQEVNDRLMRLRADFDNFRRRTRQEKEELSAVVLQNFMTELLPLVDNFERALAAETADADLLRDGIVMVYNQFAAVLQKNGLEPIKAVGEKFDPNFHQAVMRVEDTTKEDNTVVEELQKGYIVQARVIRPSMVKVIAN
ncbi:MAG: nucleotide exchange factor GrpE [Selenomonadaceae bacterium]|jgi:molecular chaperone GrpE